MLLFACYEVYGKAWQIQREQGKLTQALDQQWSDQGSGSIPDEPIPGQGVARLHIPSLGKKWVVVEGVKPRDIKSAPGHYPDSAMPDKLGNFAVAGHRTPAIFWNLDKLSEGDTIIVETRKDWYVYKVTKSKIIKPTQLNVVSANPENPGAPPKKKMLTLTTCNPKWDNYQRLVIHAQQVEAQPKSKGRPDELGG